MNMNKKCNVLIFITILLLTFLSGCERAEKKILGDQQDSYIGCLKFSFTGQHNFSASEVRSLCEEISGTSNLAYSYNGGNPIPSNTFTECYDKKVKKYAVLGKEEAKETAKIVCRYESK